MSMINQINSRLNAFLLAELHPIILEDISPSYVATEFISLNNERRIYYERFICVIDSCIMQMIDCIIFKINTFSNNSLFNLLYAATYCNFYKLSTQCLPD